MQRKPPIKIVEIAGKFARLAEPLQTPTANIEIKETQI